MRTCRLSLRGLEQEAAWIEGRRRLWNERFDALDHVVQAQISGLPYVYLGYWVSGSAKMDYKARFSPIEVLRPDGWMLMAARDRA